MAIQHSELTVSSLCSRTADGSALYSRMSNPQNHVTGLPDFGWITISTECCPGVSGFPLGHLLPCREKVIYRTGSIRRTRSTVSIAPFARTPVPDRVRDAEGHGRDAVTITTPHVPVEHLHLEHDTVPEGEVVRVKLTDSTPGRMTFRPLLIGRSLLDARRDGRVFAIVAKHFHESKRRQPRWGRRWRARDRRHWWNPPDRQRGERLVTKHKLSTCSHEAEGPAGCLLHPDP